MRGVAGSVLSFGIVEIRFLVVVARIQDGKSGEAGCGVWLLRRLEI